MSKSLAIAYSMKNKAKSGDSSCPKCGYASGEGMPMGDEDKHDGLVDRVMGKKMSDGGEVANDTHPFESDFEDPNEFDDLVLEGSDPVGGYTGANSGDEIGNASEEKAEHDIVERILKSRAKKDKMPRPA